MKTIKIYLLLLVIVASILGVASLWQNISNSAEYQIRQISNKIEAINIHLSQLEVVRQERAGNVYRAEQALNEEQQRYKEIEAEIEQANKEKQQLQAQIDKLVKRGVIKEAEADELVGNFIPSGGGIDNFLKVNGADNVRSAGDVFRAAGLVHSIKPEVLVCIAQADSSLGNALKSTNNIGNVGNNDRGDVIHYATLNAGIDAIARVLNNQYLGSYTTIGELSRGGGNQTGKVYATSEYNWNRNVVNCLRDIFQDNTINEDFVFRT